MFVEHLILRHPSVGILEDVRIFREIRFRVERLRWEFCVETEGILNEARPRQSTFRAKTGHKVVYLAEFARA